MYQRSSSAVAAPERWCPTCATGRHAYHCRRCRTPTIPRIDRRPVWLCRELRRRVEDAMGLALRELQTTGDRGRARMLRSYVLPHYMYVLDDHRRATRIRTRGGTGYRELEGTIDDQLAQVSRIPIGLIRDAASTTTSPGPPTIAASTS